MRLSPATVIASIALLFSLAGNAVALSGLITSKDKRCVVNDLRV